jgi:hypothetical protein
MRYRRFSYSDFRPRPGSRYGWVDIDRNDEPDEPTPEQKIALKKVQNVFTRRFFDR